MKIIFATLALLIGGCTHKEASAATGALTTVNSVFVERLQSSDAFSYLRFWKVPSVEGLLDSSLCQAFKDYKVTFSRANLNDIPFAFPVTTRADPLSMCTAPTKTPEVRKLQEDGTTAIYTVTYNHGIDGAKGQFYKIVCRINLSNHNGHWLVSDVITRVYADSKITTYTFPSRLQELSALLK